MRRLLIPFAAIFEIALLGLCWSLALTGFLSPAERLSNWAMSTLPDPEWYTGKSP